MLGVTDITVVVEVNFRGLQVPVCLPGLAGRIGAIRQPEVIFAFEVGPFGLTRRF